MEDLHFSLFLFGVFFFCASGKTDYLDLFSKLTTPMWTWIQSSTYTSLYLFKKNLYLCIAQDINVLQRQLLQPTVLRHDKSPVSSSFSTNS